MDEQTQWNTINTRAWYTAMRTQAAAILGALQGVGATIKQGGWIVTAVEGIECEFQLNGNDVTLNAGVKANGEPLYCWTFPIGWVTT